MKYTRKNRRLKARLRVKANEIVEAKKEGLFLSPVEARMIEVLGGKVLRLTNIKDKATGRSMTIVWKQPKLLKREHFTRTGDRLILFSNDLKMGLAIKGYEYSRDVIGAWERDEALKADGWRIKYLPLEWLINDPDKVKLAVTQFIYA